MPLRHLSPLLPLLLLTACPSAEGPGGAGGTAGQGGTGGDVGGAGGSTGGSAGMGGQPTGGAGGGAGAGGAGAGGATGGSGGSVNLCGNGAKDPGEQCDGSDFGGKTCADFGLSGGQLQCNAFCGLIVSNCTPAESCNDEQDNDQDGDVDCQDGDCAAEPVCTDSCAVPGSASPPSFEFANLAGKPNTLSNSCSSPSSGPEAVWEVTAPIDGNLTVNASGDGTVSVAIRTACDQAGTELACDVASNLGQATVSLPLLQGETVFVVVEGASPADLGFVNVDIQMPFPEGFNGSWECNDQWDNDADGFLDCGDPSQCKGVAPECTGGVKATGADCFDQTECASVGGDPFCLPSWLDDWPGGYCTDFCDPAAPDCAGDGVCAPVNAINDGNLYDVCLDGCASDVDCRPGYACKDLGLASKVCMKDVCQDFLDNDFDGLTDCEDQSGIPECDPAQCQGGALPAGSPCAQASECASTGDDPICFGPAQGFPSAMCSEFCDPAANDCPAGAACIPAVMVPSGAGQCMDKCGGANGVCQPGYVCTNVGAGVFACLP